MRTLVILSFLVSASAFAGTIECSNPSGTLQYSEWTYSGGAAPAPGMVRSRTTWKYKGETISNEVTRFPCDDLAGFECPEAEFESDSTLWYEFVGPEIRIEESPVGGQTSGYKVYATKIRFARIDETPVFPDRPELDFLESFICRLNWAYYP